MGQVLELCLESSDRCGEGQTLNNLGLALREVRQFKRGDQRPSGRGRDLPGDWRPVPRGQRAEEPGIGSGRASRRERWRIRNGARHDGRGNCEGCRPDCSFAPRHDLLLVTARLSRMATLGTTRWPRLRSIRPHGTNWMTAAARTPVNPA
jgi:hypothetical protein